MSECIEPTYIFVVAYTGSKASVCRIPSNVIISTSNVIISMSNCVILNVLPMFASYAFASSTDAAIYLDSLQHRKIFYPVNSFLSFWNFLTAGSYTAYLLNLLHWKLPQFNSHPLSCSPPHRKVKRIFFRHHQMHERMLPPNVIISILKNDMCHCFSDS